MARTPDQMAEDSVFIVKNTGERLGPYQAAVNSRQRTIEVFNDALEVDVGDRVERNVPPNKIETYEILDVHYETETHGVFAPYLLDVQRQGAPVRPARGGVSNTFHISGDSANIQVGDHNIQNVLHVMQSLVTEIERADTTPEEKAEAKSRLQAFLSHPLVVTLMGSAASGFIADLANKT